MKKKAVNRILRKSISLIMGLLVMGAYSSCSESKSYSELLNEEQEAVNWFLAQKKVELELPEDSISFITGEDAPFYKLDEDGYVYMQVISKGDLSDRVKNGDLVYFRFNRMNIKYLYEGQSAEWSGNTDNLVSDPMGSESGSNYTRFVYENQYLSSTTKWGIGIQMPLKYLGYDSEVNLVLRSYYGFTADITVCMPYLINIRYFRPEY